MAESNRIEKRLEMKMVAADLWQPFLKFYQSCLLFGYAVNNKVIHTVPSGHYVLDIGLSR